MTDLVIKAAEYFTLAEQQCNVFYLASIESLSEDHGLGLKMFKFISSPYAHKCFQACGGLFIINQFLPESSPEQVALDTFCLVVLTSYAMSKAYYEWRALGWLHTLTTIDAAANLLAIVCLILHWVLGAPMLDFFRPVLVILGDVSLMLMLRVFTHCVYESGTVLAFTFTCMALVALLLFVLYQGELDSDEGETVDDFQRAFVSTFAFLESADNWETLVYNIYRVSKFGALLMLPMSVFGCFFLMSMLLAIFEGTYDEKYQNVILPHTRARYRLALAVSYSLLVYGSDDASDGESPDVPQLSHPKYNTFMEAVGITSTEQVRELVFYELDQNKSGTVDFKEFEHLVFLAR